MWDTLLILIKIDGGFALMGEKIEKQQSKFFSDKIKSEMDKQGMSLRKLASETNINPSYLSRILRGIQKPPSNEKIRDIAEVLNIDSNELIAEAGKFSDNKPNMARLFRAAGTLSEKELKDVLKVVNDIAKKKAKNR